MIVFKNESLVVDGVPSGDIVSTISNYPTRKSEILEAFQVARKSEKQKYESLAEQISANAKATHAEQLAAAKADHADSMSRWNEERELYKTNLASAVSELAEIVDLLGGETVVAGTGGAAGDAEDRERGEWRGRPDGDALQFRAGAVADHADLRWKRRRLS